MLDIDELKFVRVFDPIIIGRIPRVLFEQIPNREWEVNNLLILAPMFLSSPMNWFYVLSGIDNVIKGILWATIDPVVQVLCVNVFSVDREYQKLNGSLRKSQSKLVLKARDFLREEIKKTKLKEKILWATTRPRAFKRIGAKESKRTIMEISLC